MKNQEFIVCDDAKMMRDILCSVMRTNGYLKVRAAADGKELFQAIQEKEPFGILLDIHFPDESGLDMLERVKKEYPETKVIMVTGDETEESKQKAMEYGADAYITKPFQSKDIVEALERLAL